MMDKPATISEQNARAADLVAKAEALAQRERTVEDELHAEAEAHIEPLPAAPLAQPDGFVDLVFVEGRLLEIVDAHGHRTEIGHWLEDRGQERLRIPWPPHLPPREGRIPPSATSAYLRRPATGTQTAKVLAAFIRDWREGGLGIFDEELAVRTELPHASAARARVELIHQGWLRASGRKVLTRKRKQAVQWELTPAGVSRLNLTNGGSA
jgi:hypothetical protein